MIDPERYLKKYRDIKAEMDRMTGQELIDSLAITFYSSYPEFYRHRLPSGLEYVSEAQGLNCYDFAQRCRGKHWLDVKDLVPTLNAEGMLVVYFIGSNIKDYRHAGIVIEGGNRVISQWSVGGPVFKHLLMQIPQNYGHRHEFFQMPIH